MILNIYGPSGAGKTTFIKDLLKYSKINDLYQQLINQHVEEDLNKKISVSLMPLPLFRGTVKEFFRIFNIETDTLLNLNCELSNLSASIFKEIKTSILLEKFSLRNIETFSAGEIRRLFLLRSLLVDSNMVIIDEPFANSDEELRNIILKAISIKSKSILLSHNPLDELFENKENLFSVDIKNIRNNFEVL